jgi:transposase-like protein
MNDILKDEFLNLATLSHLFTDETAAREFIESKVWPTGPVCPHCACVDVYKLTPKAESTKPIRAGVYKCKACRKQFTVRIGTIFEDSHIPFSKWLMTIHLMTSSKKGVSSLQISRELGITYRSAWFMTHRIREAMKMPDGEPPLNGTVEVDETYVGGKPRKGTGKHKRGAGTSKQPVMVLVERDGEGVHCMPIEAVNRKNLRNEIDVKVAKEAVIMTDENPSYTGLANDFEGHETVCHIKGEYSRRMADGNKAHVNTAESFFALLKRGHYGIFHKLSKKHLHRYCTEFSFRWSFRKVTDGERMVAAIQGVTGKRLFYVQPVEAA